MIREWIHALRGAGILIALGCVASCSARWDAPTFFIFEDLDPALQPRVRAAVGAYGFQELSATELEDLGLEPGDFGFRLTNLPAVGDLKSAHAALEAALQSSQAPPRLCYAELRYASVAAPASSAAVELTAQGRASAGSTLRLDVGAPQVIVMPVLEDGIWSVSIPHSPGLQARGGWIYGLAEKSGARQYFRLNVLTGAQEGLRRGDLPADTRLP